MRIDATEFHIASAKLYPSPILYLHTREIIYYNVSKSQNFQQIKDMIDQALSKFDNLRNWVFHSNQGWQYQMKYYQKIVKKKSIRQSMSRKENYYDNSQWKTFLEYKK